MDERGDPWGVPHFHCGTNVLCLARIRPITKSMSFGAIPASTNARYISEMLRLLKAFLRSILTMSLFPSFYSSISLNLALSPPLGLFKNYSSSNSNFEQSSESIDLSKTFRRSSEQQTGLYCYSESADFLGFGIKCGSKRKRLGGWIRELCNVFWIL